MRRDDVCALAGHGVEIGILHLLWCISASATKHSVTPFFCQNEERYILCLVIQS